MSERMFPKWVTDAIADDLEKRADRIEAMFGPEAAEEPREIAADLRAIKGDGE